MRKSIALFLVLTAAGLALVACAGGAQQPAAKPKATFEPKKDVTWIVPYNPGGGYDAYSRGVAKVAEKSLPSGIKINILNRAGGGSVLGSETLKRADPDGHTIGVVDVLSLATIQLLGGAEATIDVTKDYKYLAGMTSDPYVLWAPARAGIKSVEELKGTSKVIKVGSISAASVNVPVGVIAGNLFNFKRQWVTAYQGAGDKITGALRGDIDIGSLEASSIASYVEKGDIVPLLVFDTQPSSQLPKAPTAASAGAPDAIIVSSRPVAGPRGMPDHVVAYWTQLLQKTMQDPELTKWAQESKRPVDWASSESVSEKVVKNFAVFEKFKDQILKEKKEIGD